jgi:hypothetical protein
LLRLAQVAPTQPLHGDVHAMRRQAGVMHGDDMRVVQPGGRACFVQEQCIQRHARRCVDVELQCLHRHRARQQRVPGLEHCTQSALAELLLQRIAADARQRGLCGCLGVFAADIAARIETEVGEHIGHGRIGRPRRGNVETGHRDHGRGELRCGEFDVLASLEEAMSHSDEA